jgi:hypothetical protein
VVCALWPTTSLSDDTRCLIREWQANTARRRNVAITNDIRGDTRRHPRCWANLDEGRDVSCADFITQQEVVFSTAAALPSRRATRSRRLIDAIRVVGAALHRPPARRHYPQRSGYLELSRMAREMDRL